LFDKRDDTHELVQNKNFFSSLGETVITTFVKIQNKANLKYRLPYILLLILCSLSWLVSAQVEKGGQPRSFRLDAGLKSQLQAVEVTPPDMELLRIEDMNDARLEKSYRAGIEIPVSLSTKDDIGQWDLLPGGGRIWRLAMNCADAQAIGINYSELRLPDGADIFVYTPDQLNIIGAITNKEISHSTNFTTRPLPGNKIILEYYEPETVAFSATINISGIVFIYRGFGSTELRIGKSVASGNCEVNVNCGEGQNWQNQKKAVVKILTKVGTKYFYCTGTVVNNTAQDFSGLLLTASHCSSDFNGTIATESDFSQWVFYFNYETPACTYSSVEEYTLVGAQKIAVSDNPSNIGSDFLLLRFISDIPLNYYPYYCGWDAGNGNSSSGVCIHHPDGDMKKISTYTTPLGSGTWGSTPDTHWTVVWAATDNGHGVTEGGSSGSPLFDEEGLLAGTLTGGLSSCQNPTGEDMYGKVSYSWESNGLSSSQQLKPWLDPGNTGTIKMPGSFNDKQAVADFSANSLVIPVGGTVDFQDLSSGKPESWHWYFQGGKPSESTEQNPSGIRFERYGAMNVKLVVSNTLNSDTTVKEEYIDVRAVVSPNPCNGVVNILTDINDENDIIIEVYDATGKMAMRYNYGGSTSASRSITLPEYGNVFIIRVIQGNHTQTHKVVVSHSG